MIFPQSLQANVEAHRLQQNSIKDSITSTQLSSISITQEVSHTQQPLTIDKIDKQLSNGKQMAKDNNADVHSQTDKNFDQQFQKTVISSQILQNQLQNLILGVKADNYYEIHQQQMAVARQQALYSLNLLQKSQINQATILTNAKIQNQSEKQKVDNVMHVSASKGTLNNRQKEQILLLSQTPKSQLCKQQQRITDDKEVIKQNTIQIGNLNFEQQINKVQEVLLEEQHDHECKDSKISKYPDNILIQSLQQKDNSPNKLNYQIIKVDLDRNANQDSNKIENSNLVQQIQHQSENANNNPSKSTNQNKQSAVKIDDQADSNIVKLQKILSQSTQSNSQQKLAFMIDQNIQKIKDCKKEIQKQPKVENKGNQNELNSKQQDFSQQILVQSKQQEQMNESIELANQQTNQHEAKITILDATKMVSDSKFRQYGQHKTDIQNKQKENQKQDSQNQEIQQKLQKTYETIENNMQATGEDNIIYTDSKQVTVTKIMPNKLQQQDQTLDSDIFAKIVKQIVNYVLNVQFSSNNEVYQILNKELKIPKQDPQVESEIIALQQFLVQWNEYATHKISIVDIVKQSSDSTQDNTYDNTISVEQLLLLFKFAKYKVAGLNFDSLKRIEQKQSGV